MTFLRNLLCCYRPQLDPVETSPLLDVEPKPEKRDPTPLPENCITEIYKFTNPFGAEVSFNNGVSDLTSHNFFTLDPTSLTSIKTSILTLKTHKDPRENGLKGTIVFEYMSREEACDTIQIRCELTRFSDNGSARKTFPLQDFQARLPTFKTEGDLSTWEFKLRGTQDIAGSPSIHTITLSRKFYRHTD